MKEEAYLEGTLTLRNDLDGILEINGRARLLKLRCSDMLQKVLTGDLGPVDNEGRVFGYKRVKSALEVVLTTLDDCFDVTLGPGAEGRGIGFRGHLCCLGYYAG